LKKKKNDFQIAIDIENYSKGLLLLPDDSLKQEFIKDFSFISELRGVWFEVITPNNDKTMREFIKDSLNFVCERWVYIILLIKIMKKDTYTQCSLKRINQHHMAWIPSKFAVMNKFIKIKKDDKTWEDGWEVIGVSQGTRSVEDVTEKAKIDKKFGSSIK
jgi:hypothetical protein